MMSAIQKLIDAGRDPLEAVLVPPAPDVAEWIAEDENAKLDAAIVEELRGWSKPMLDRLHYWIERRKAGGEAK